MKQGTQLFVVSFSSVLNVPWIIELVKKWRASRQKKQKKKTPETSHVDASPKSTKKRGGKR